MAKTSENAGETPLSSSGENKEYTDHNKQPASMVRRSAEMLGSPTTLSHLPTRSSQQPRTSPPVYNSNITTAKELAHHESIQSLNHAQNNVDDRNLIPASSESDVVEHLFMPHAMERPPHGSMLTSAHHSSGSSKNNSTAEASKAYHLPTSNLPPEFRLGYSSRYQLPQTPEANWRSGSFLAKTNWTDWQPFSHITTHEPDTNLGSQDFGFQSLLNEAIASDNFHETDDRPIQHIVGSSTVGVSSPFQLGGIPSNPNKRKISWQEDSPSTPNLNFVDWMSLGEGNQGQNNMVPTASGSRSKIIRNKLYDPSYAAMGLPVDPHLRMFHARHVNCGFIYNINSSSRYEVQTNAFATFFYLETEAFFVEEKTEGKDNDNNREDCGSKIMPSKTS